MDKMEKGLEQSHGCEKGLASWFKKSFLKIPAKTLWDGASSVCQVPERQPEAENREAGIKGLLGLSEVTDSELTPIKRKAQGHFLLCAQEAVSHFRIKEGS